MKEYGISSKYLNQCKDVDVGMKLYDLFLLIKCLERHLSYLSMILLLELSEIFQQIFKLHVISARLRM